MSSLRYSLDDVPGYVKIASPLIYGSESYCFFCATCAFASRGPIANDQADLSILASSHRKMAHGLKKDPAIEQFAHMRAHTQEYFRVNKKSGPFLFVVVGLIPLALGYLSYRTHGQMQLAGVRRNESVWR